uniref:CHAT domain-containing protein n=1 Tax=Candidatus Kentrum sp. TUN TaxID=2126343 RepID=A0A450ZBV6_9GAMM|nr:MAG: CHAT domain-containing protein [Candidatus Kentron sp. TUN]
MNQRLRAERGGFAALGNTKPEAEAIAKQYARITGQPAEVWHGMDAGEGRLKARLSPTAQAPRVLHLATHGFFLAFRGRDTDSKRGVMLAEDFMGGMPDASPRPAASAPASTNGQSDRPMTLSGLALVGANRGMGGNPGPDGEDGVLYALEAQSLNLQGTELVVLSACDTGQREIDVSDGIYGLTRAFRIAGARNVLMTLWPLDDALAREFMEDFYCNWLGGGLGGEKRARCEGKPLPIAEALRQTRLAWIESGDARRRDPKYWAPYVLVE